MTRLPRTSAALLLISACRPLVYTFDEAGMSQGADTEPTDGDPTDGKPTDPGHSDPTQPDSCLDQIFDNDETDVDCGGPCPPCDPGLSCHDPSDCQSNNCMFGTCSGNEPLCNSDDDCDFLNNKDPCTRGVCLPDATCTFKPAADGEPCDDGDPCTDATLCKSGTCTGSPRTCDELAAPCRNPFCNSTTGKCAVEFDAPGSECDDGLDCSQFDACNDIGECTGKPELPTFVETFTMPQGWQTDMLWMIDVATASSCDVPGSDDPGSDHTGDGFLAGLLIGGCTPFAEFPPTCLTSPILDMPPGPEPIELRYWSQLSSAGFPMQASVELFDGQVWSPLQVLDTPVFEKQWTEHAFQLPLQPIFQVRFCQSQKEVNMQSVGGWSLDDISIGPAPCGP